ncbi:MAG: threonine synthase [Verrucomicrobia bacterium]|nr:threonine synthase [Verrucomicrobiota bacterium]
MNYISTRGRTPPMGFQDAVLTGLAPDGGLLIPTDIPRVEDRLDAWSRLSYQDITFEILRLFVDLPDGDLRHLIERSYMAFRHPEIAPAWPVGPVHILELFHGPTLAFKDIALQFLSNFFEYILKRRDARLNILGATSGDTGSAAIHGVRGRERINIFIMHPRGRVAPLQERQMTAVLDSNVFNIAVEGTFDDCQRIMKTLFSDLEFKRRHALGAVNSVNWARVLVQIVYYFSAGLYVMQTTGAREVQFAVPTGNFGDVLAGYYAWRMGMPIRRLILATNENDILARFFESGVYSLGRVVPTLSPSMDVQVASNFERYLYYKGGGNPERLTALMKDFAATGSLSIPCGAGGRVDELFIPGVGTSADTLATIRRYDREYGYLLDPHTAVGVHVAEQHLDREAPTICLATAHPAKFSQAIREATGREAHHEILDNLAHAPTRCATLPADVEAVKSFIEERAR